MNDQKQTDLSVKSRILLKMQVTWLFCEICTTNTLDKGVLPVFDYLFVLLGPEKALSMFWLVYDKNNHIRFLIILRVYHLSTTNTSDNVM